MGKIRVPNNVDHMNPEEAFRAGADAAIAMLEEQDSEECIFRQHFVDRFGELHARHIEEAARMHSKKKTDFVTSIITCIHYKCMEDDIYRKLHHITPSWLNLKSWIKEYIDGEYIK